MNDETKTKEPLDELTYLRQRIADLEAFIEAKNMKNRIFSCLITALAAVYFALFLNGCSKVKQVEKDADKPIDDKKQSF